MAKLSRALRSTLCPLFALTLLHSTAHAVQPRDYIPHPAGTTAVQFLHMQGSGNELYQDGDKVSDDFNIDTNINVFLPVYYTTFLSMPAIVEAIVPFGRVEIDGAAVGNDHLSTSGLADPTLLLGFWPVSDPANKTWFGVSGWLTAPLGDYDADRPLNLGRNQWAFKAQTGLVKGFGDFVAEVIPSVEVYSNNNDFGAEGHTLKREPLYAVETHLSYDVNSSVMVSLDNFFSRGGETTRAGHTIDPEINTHSMQLTTRLALAPNQLVHFQYLRDLSVENGPKTSRFSVQFTYAF